MSKWLNYATNLLDSVDNIARENLVDQDSAAERRRNKRRENSQTLFENTSDGENLLPPNSVNDTSFNFQASSELQNPNSSADGFSKLLTNMDDDVIDSNVHIADTHQRLTEDVATLDTESRSPIIASPQKLSGDISNAMNFDTNLFNSPATSSQQKTIPKNSVKVDSKKNTALNEYESYPHSTSTINSTNSSTKVENVYLKEKTNDLNLVKNAQSVMAIEKKLRKEVEDLSLELEFMELRVKEQESELKSAAENIAREKEKYSKLSVQATQENLRLKNEYTQNEQEFMNAMALKTAALAAEIASNARIKEEKEQLSNQLNQFLNREKQSDSSMKTAMLKAEEARKEGLLAAECALLQLREVEARSLEVNEAAKRAAFLARTRQEQLEMENANMYKEIVNMQKELDMFKKLSVQTQQSGDKHDYEDSRTELLKIKEEFLEQCNLTNAANKIISDLRRELGSIKLSSEEKNLQYGKDILEAKREAETLKKELERIKSSNEPGFEFHGNTENSNKKVKDLTEQVLRKQKVIETLTSERATLLTKLSIAENRAISFEKSSALDMESQEESKFNSGMNTSSRRRNRTPPAPISNMTPIIARHTNVASAIDSIDRLSLIAGNFLRNIPAARALFLLYLIVLHLWMCVIIAMSLQKMEDIHADTGNEVINLSEFHT